MKTFLLAASLLIPAPVLAQSTAFTYQGELERSGSPATGVFDFEFALFDGSLGGNRIAGPITVENVFVDGGLFTAEVDFGASAFGGADTWLEIRVRPGSSIDAFTIMMPRQKVTPAPLALNARNVAASAIGTLQVADGAVTGSKVDRGEVQLRVGSSCSPGASIRAINDDGTVECEADDDSGGDISGVIAGEGLVGGAANGNASLSADFGLIRRKNDPVVASSSSGNAARLVSESSDALLRLDSLNGGPLIEGGTDSLMSNITIDAGGAVLTEGNVTADAFIGDGSQVTAVDAETLDGVDSTGFAPKSHTHPPDGAGVYFVSAHGLEEDVKRQLSDAGRVDWDRSFPYVRITGCITSGSCPSLSLSRQIRLPQGAEIETFTLLHYDNDPDSDWRIIAFLRRIELAAGAFESVADVVMQSSGSLDAVQADSDASSDTRSIVDNTKYAYYVEVILFDDSRALSPDLRLYGLRINYSLPE